jgi:GntR family transcriptional regulator / MocR family aminotransferase
VDAVRRELSEHLIVEPADAGMTLITWLRDGDDVSVAKAAERAGVDLLPLSRFAIEQPIPHGLLLGYSGVCEADLRDGVTRLAAVFDGLQRPSPERRVDRLASFTG